MKTILSILMTGICLYVTAQPSADSIKQQILGEFHRLTEINEYIGQGNQTARVHYTMYTQMSNGQATIRRDSITSEVLANEHVRIFRNSIFEMLIGENQVCYVSHINKQIISRTTEVNTQTDYFAKAFGKESLEILQNTNCEHAGQNEKGEAIVYLHPLKDTATIDVIEKIEVRLDSQTGKIREYIYHIKTQEKGISYTQHVIIHALEIGREIKMPKKVDDYYRTRNGQPKAPYTNYQIIEI